jgi:hypothetical protein
VRQNGFTVRIAAFDVIERHPIDLNENTIWVSERFDWRCMVQHHQSASTLSEANDCDSTSHIPLRSKAKDLREPAVDDACCIRDIVHANVTGRNLGRDAQRMTETCVPYRLR